MLLLPHLLVGQSNEGTSDRFCPASKGQAGLSPFGINKHKGWSRERQPTML